MVENNLNVKEGVEDVHENLPLTKTKYGWNSLVPYVLRFAKFKREVDVHA